jgi:hypothetical protein
VPTFYIRAQLQVARIVGIGDLEVPLAKRYFCRVKDRACVVTLAFKGLVVPIPRAPAHRVLDHREHMQFVGKRVNARFGMRRMRDIIYAEVIGKMLELIESVIGSTHSLLPLLLASFELRDTSDMSMIEYIQVIKRNMRDQYACTVIGGTEADPLLEAPDGEYPMTIEDKLDHVLIKEGNIYCCRFQNDSTDCGVPNPQQADQPLRAL